MQKSISFLLLIALIALINGELKAQDDRPNVITTAVPFLTITPDARHGALATVGAATSPDVYDQYHNAAKLSFIEDTKGGFALSYTPWLGNLVPGISLSFLSGFVKIDKMSAVGFSMRYFSLGDIQFTDEFGNKTIQHRPNEFSFDGSYSRKLAQKFSMSISLRFVYSNLTGGQNVGGAQTKPGLALASDIFAYYQNDDISLGSTDATLAFGTGISNIGSKMTYSDLNEKDFLPMNFKFGLNFTIHLDDYNDISFVGDVNKLLVPTPPIYETNVNKPNYGEIVAGKDPNRSVASAIFTSWADAPGVPLTESNGDYLLNSEGVAEVEKGSVFQEEMREFYFGFGFEYWYNQLFAARLGYFAEHATKGNRKYLSFGIGVKYNVFALDVAYLVPFYVGKQTNYGESPLQNTLQFSLAFVFEGSKKGGVSDKDM